MMLYGGGRTGLMGSAADAALAAGGVVEGVILDAFVGMDVHHRGLHRLDEVGDMRSRKRALEEGADAFIALPGGLGTLEELTEVLSFRKLGFHERAARARRHGRLLPAARRADRARDPRWLRRSRDARRVRGHRRSRAGRRAVRRARAESLGGSSYGR